MDDDTRKSAWPVKKFHSLTHLFSDFEWLNHGSGFDVACVVTRLLRSSDLFVKRAAEMMTNTSFDSVRHWQG